MVKSTIFVAAAACASVSAFVTPSVPVAARNVVTRSSLQMSSMDSLVGVSSEAGGKVFDPLNLAQWAPADRLRKSELANGRTAMLAVVGWVFPELIGKFPASDVTSTHGFDALSETSLFAWAQILAVCGLIEMNQIHFEMKGEDGPFFDPAGLYPKDKAGQEKMQLAELKNGRLAMIAFAAFACHVLVPGSVPGFIFPF